MTRLASLSFAACAVAASLSSTANAETRPMTATDLATLKRLGSPAVSPDGKLLVYQLRSTDLEANKGRTDIWIMPATGGEARPFAAKPEVNESDPAFSPDGRYVWFLSSEGGSSQLWRAPVGGGEGEKVSSFKTDVAGFKLSPDGKSVAIWADIARDCPSLDCETKGDRSAKGPGSGREYDAQFVRHWDSWETPGEYSRVFTYVIGPDGKLTNPAATDGDGAEALNGDAPSKPFGGAEEIAWSADSKSLYYTLRIADYADQHASGGAHLSEAVSTDLDIYKVSADGGAPVKQTPANRATDTMPAPSPDGKWLAWAAMARPGYESDKLTVMLRDNRTGKERALTKDWDRSVGSITWSPDSRSLLVTAGDTLDTPLFNVGLNGKVMRLTNKGHVSSVLPLKDGRIIVGMDSLNAPTDLYLWEPKEKLTRLTAVNPELDTELAQVTTQRFSFAGANNEKVWGQIIKPEGATGKLPVLFVVHGGPQGSFGDGWSFRWNPKVMASQGYAVVTIDFHGSTGYGQAFTDSINQDWGGKPLEDLKLGLAAAGKTDAQIDIGNACALGASYGGYMMNWIAGQWNDGFKCLVNHAGLFDMRSFYYATEELWFPRWDFGGSYAEKTELYEKWNPVNHVDKWKTPTLVIHGEKDFRVPYGQSLMAFTALQERGIPSKLLVFPDENHWILKAKNSIQWHNAVFDWVGSHLKGE